MRNAVTKGPDCQRAVQLVLCRATKLRARGQRKCIVCDLWTDRASMLEVLARLGYAAKNQAPWSLDICSTSQEKNQKGRSTPGMVREHSGPDASRGEPRAPTVTAPRTRSSLFKTTTLIVGSRSMTNGSSHGQGDPAFSKRVRSMVRKACLVLQSRRVLFRANPSLEGTVPVSKRRRGRDNAVHPVARLEAASHTG